MTLSDGQPIEDKAAEIAAYFSKGSFDKAWRAYNSIVKGLTINTIIDLTSDVFIHLEKAGFRNYTVLRSIEAAGFQEIVFCKQRDDRKAVELAAGERIKP